MRKGFRRVKEFFGRFPLFRHFARRKLATKQKKVIDSIVKNFSEEFLAYLKETEMEGRVQWSNIQQEKLKKTIIDALGATPRLMQAKNLLGKKFRFEPPEILPDYKIIIWIDPWKDPKEPWELSLRLELYGKEQLKVSGECPV